MLSARAGFAVIVVKIWSKKAKRKGFNMNDGIIYIIPCHSSTCFLLLVAPGDNYL
jgi:hypothetical protein